jgi:N-acetylmuramoyl-L-alanine amidase
MKAALWLLFLMLAFGGVANANPNALMAVKVGPKSIQMTFLEQTKPDMRVFTLTNPDRLVIDFKRTAWQAKDPSLPRGSVIKGFRRAKNSADTYRLVFDLVGSASVEAGYRPPILSISFSKIRPAVIPKIAEKQSKPTPTQDSPPRPQMIGKRDVPPQQPSNPEQPSKTSAETPLAPVIFSSLQTKDTIQEPLKTDKTDPALAGVAPEKPKKSISPASDDPIVIVLDPGHGGKDPGATGKRGTQEKNLVLKAAQELAAAFRALPGYKVVMTRNGDDYISLRGRIEVARAANADLFISLHADSAINSEATGMSVYTLSERASDREAAKLANKENQSDIIAGVDLSEESQDVSNILIDLVQRGTMNASADYATRLVTELSSTIKLKYESHRFAGFVVLKAPDVPSVLIEMGYLSNPKEEWLLLQKSYREKLIQGIVAATQSYFSDHPKNSQHVSWQP